ncbi:hypothetical protein XFF6990_390090 [Xanthomonas citri pv. fuscans]|uniref:Uncharacterized protein n=1 Tax=Xanthomonas campestris pv. phaseoli TaxID=317013 RepID=A0A7Z7IXQ0_XANCH|nr:hypothetical protein XFF6990_390090 [Xanthomonas citri pv. fuscans]SOO23512.1 hypothetical protein XFF6991_280171 [Xanthomonas phaseoli pv. phaseoli]
MDQSTRNKSLYMSQYHWPHSFEMLTLSQFFLKQTNDKSF